MLLATLCARQTLVMDSPWPVVETAPTSLSAQPPAPTMGESPTLPGLFPVMPPVEVAAARASYKEFGHSHWWELIEIFVPKFGLWFSSLFPKWELIPLGIPTGRI